MKGVIVIFIVIGSCLPFAVCGQGEVDTTSRGKIFVVSGMGWGFGLGETNEVLGAKFSSNLGLDISLRDPKYFLYPSLDFLVFDYNQRVIDPDYAYYLERGRSNFYTLNLAGGIKRQMGIVNTYVFAGPGFGVIGEPRSAVSAAESVVRIKNTYHITPSLRAGTGANIRLGNFYLFVEGAWLHNFTRIQDRSVHVFSIYGGLKTDVTRLADNVTKAIGIDTGIAP